MEKEKWGAFAFCGPFFGGGVACFLFFCSFSFGSCSVLTSVPSKILGTRAVKPYAFPCTLQPNSDAKARTGQRGELK